ncbi:hypothetical protein, partial [Ochrobactrum soli]|uniref:hypothetical protein n=1 Tax=Ochrobactrum soli TaxID=2448455 RepID=UPI001AEDF146
RKSGPAKKCAKGGIMSCRHNHLIASQDRRIARRLIVGEKSETPPSIDNNSALGDRNIYIGIILKAAVD